MPHRSDPYMIARVDDKGPLADIISEAYEVFFVRPPVDLEVCTSCCLCPNTERDMLSGDSVDLTRAQIWEWHNSARAQPGPMSKGAWCFVLPRILEILAANDDPHQGLGPEAAFQRFPTGERARWSAREWDVLERFRVALLDQCQVPGALTQDGLVGYIACFVNGGFDLEPMIAQIKGWPKDALIQRLYDDWHRGASIWYSSEAEAAILDRLAASDVLDPLLQHALRGAEGSESGMFVCDLLMDYAQTRARARAAE